MKIAICFVAALAIFPCLTNAGLFTNIFQEFKGKVLQAVPLRDRYLRLWELVDVRKKLEKGTMVPISFIAYIKVFKNEKNELWNIRDDIFKNITTVDPSSQELLAFENAFVNEDKFYAENSQKLNSEEAFDADLATEYIDTLIAVRETFEEWMNLVYAESHPDQQKQMAGGLLNFLGLADEG